MRELSGDRPAPGTAAPDGAARRRPATRRSPRAAPREPWWRRITWKKVVAGVLGFIVFWLALSLVLFMISANQQADKVSDGTKAALDDSGNLLTRPTTSWCWAPTAARERSAAAPTRSC